MKRQKRKKRVHLKPQSLSTNFFRTYFPPDAFKPLWLITTVFTLGFLLRIPTLGMKSLWFDEVRSFYDAQTIRYSATAHPLAFWLMHLSLELGGVSDFFLRLPSAIAGILALPIALLIGYSLAGRKGGILSGVLLALSSYHIWYSQEARYYSLMIFFSLLALFFVVQAQERKTLYPAAGFLAAAALLRRLHPTTMVFILAFLFYLPISLLVQRRFLQKCKPVSVAQHIRQHWIKLLLFLLIVFAWMHFEGPAVWRTAKARIPKFPQILSSAYAETAPPHKAKRAFSPKVKKLYTPGVRPTPRFFLWHLEQFGSITGYDRLGQAGKWYLYLLFLLGFIYLARFKPLFFSGALLATAATFYAIFSVRVKQTYDIKYISFLYPFYIFFQAAGLCAIADGANWLSKRLFAQQRRRFEYALIGAAFLPLLAIDLRALIPYYSEERMGYKPTVRFFKKNAAKDAVLVSFGLDAFSIKYYASYFNLPGTNIVELPRTANSLAMGKERLKKLYAQKSQVWFFQCWTYDTPQGLVEFSRTQADEIKTFPTHPGPYCCPAYLMRSKWNARNYVSPAIPYHFPLEHQEPIEIRFERGGRYELYARDKAKSVLTRLPFNLPAGIQQLDLHRIGLSSEVQAAATSLMIYPAFSEGASFEAEAADYVYPSYFNRTDVIDYRTAYVMERNSFVGYEIILPEAGCYKFSLSARNDRPATVLIETRFDEKSLGIFSFSQNDDSWSTKALYLNATAGKHRIDFAFLNNTPVSLTVPDKNRNAYMDYFILQRLDAAKPKKPSDAMRLKGKLASCPLNYFAQYREAIREGKFPPRWRAAYKDAAVTIDKGETLGRLPTFHAIIPPEANGVNIYSAPFRVQPGRWLYFSAKIKTKSLENHSANLLVIFADNQGRKVGAFYVNQEGILHTTPWTRFVCFRQTPPNAKIAVVIFTVYSNSRKPSTEIGEVWFGDFRPENY